MAVFMINECKFNGCDRTYSTLGDLIYHIEETHIDTDPATTEEREASQPSCLPLSYVLKFFSESSKRDNPPSIANHDAHRKVIPSFVIPPSIRSLTPTGSEFDEDELYNALSDDSNNSWTTTEEFSTDYILRLGCRVTNNGPNGPSEKPFACPVPGCEKRYKNVNGIKYHAKNGHKKDGKIKKGHKCHCGKNYQTLQGLKTHSISQHYAHRQSPTPASHRLPSPTPPPFCGQSTKPVSLPVMKALQGFVGASHPSNAFNNNKFKTMSQIQNVPEIENTRAIRAVLENVGGRPPKDRAPVAVPALPKHNLNFNRAHAINCTNAMYRAKFETDVSNYVETKPSHKIFSQYQIENNNSLPNSLGILTPASSPNSAAYEKMICSSEDEKFSPCERKSNYTVNPNEPSLPLTPATPDSGCQINFPVNGIVTK